MTVLNVLEKSKLCDGDIFVYSLPCATNYTESVICMWPTFHGSQLLRKKGGKKSLFCPFFHSVSPVSHPHFSHTLQFPSLHALCTAKPHAFLNMLFLQEYKSGSWEKEKESKRGLSKPSLVSEWDRGMRRQRKRRICFHKAAVNPSLAHSGISVQGGGESTSARSCPSLRSLALPRRGAGLKPERSWHGQLWEQQGKFPSISPQ